MKKFTIMITSARTATVTDNATKKTYNCKVEPYHRDKNGKPELKFQVRVDKVPGNLQSSGVIQVPMNKQGKFMKTFETDLSGKKSTSIDSELNFGEMFN